MLRHKKILAAVDGFEASFHALKEAIRLAQWGKGGVTAIAVAPSYEGDLSLVGVKDLKAALSGRSEDIVKRVEEIAAAQGARIEVIREEGEPHRKIAERAAAGGFDCIALGAGEERGFLAGLIPGVLAKLTASSTTDVLVVPQGKELRWDRILFAGETSVNKGFFAVRALELAHSYGAELDTVLLSDSKLNASGWRACGVICAAAAESNPGVIVIGSDRLTRLKRFGKSPLERILELCGRPVYVIKLREGSTRIAPVRPCFRPPCGREPHL